MCSRMDRKDMPDIRGRPAPDTKTAPRMAADFYQKVVIGSAAEERPWPTHRNAGMTGYGMSKVLPKKSSRRSAGGTVVESVAPIELASLARYY